MLASQPRSITVPRLPSLLFTSSQSQGLSQVLMAWTTTFSTPAKSCQPIFIVFRGSSGGRCGGCGGSAAPLLGSNLCYAHIKLPPVQSSKPILSWCFWPLKAGGRLPGVGSVATTSSTGLKNFTAYSSRVVLLRVLANMCQVVVTRWLRGKLSTVLEWTK